jgi:hypothetical protein
MKKIRYSNTSGEKMKDLPEITKEEFLQSISHGVRDAILTMTESGDGFSGEIIREPFLSAIEEGMYNAISDNIDFPTEDDLKSIYFDAVSQAQ